MRTQKLNMARDLFKELGYSPNQDAESRKKAIATMGFMLQVNVVLMNVDELMDYPEKLDFDGEDVAKD